MMLQMARTRVGGVSRVRTLTHAHTRPVALQRYSRWLHASPAARAAPAAAPSAGLSRVRNIGIIAHIDAGKTTVGERFLFLSGATRRCGEVHDGDTVLDFMPQERERGITIKAAATTFGWAGATLNLIDTPGHVDFTIEVERAVRVLDGGIALFDGVAGVQAQSACVCKQAHTHGVPLLGFVNKMDRDGASYTATAEAIRTRLGMRPLLLQVPLGEAANFAGVSDCVHTHVCLPPTDAAPREPARITLPELAEKAVAGSKLKLRGVGPGRPELVLSAAEVVRQMRVCRDSLVEALAEADDAVADAWLAASDAVGGATESSDVAALQRSVATPGLTPEDLSAAIRRVVCTQSHTRAKDVSQRTADVKEGDEAHEPKRQTVLPLLAGSAYRNTGIHELLDAVVRYLPSPLDAHVRGATHAATGRPVQVTVSDNAPLRALAFKVQNHPSRGPLVFFRIYSGVMTGKQPVLNVSKGVKERPGKLLQVLADDTREVDAIAAGHIGAATGLKSVATGDTLCVAGDPHPVLLPGVPVPPPVFTAAVETNSTSEQKQLEEALAIMVREDPSLTVGTNADTGQLLVSGMGELHLEIAADRLRREHNVAVTLGKPMVAYKECLRESATAQCVYDRVLGTKRHVVRLALAFHRRDDLSGREHVRKDEPITCRHVASSDQPDSGAQRVLAPALADALREGIAASMERGPSFGFPLSGVAVEVLADECEVYPETSPAAIRACIAKCFTEGLQSGGVDVLEPTMCVEVVVPDRVVGDVISDLVAGRRGRIRDVRSGAYTGDGAAPASASTSVVHADVPLREMVGYSTWLRSRTAGEGTFTMSFAALSSMDDATVQKLRHGEL